MTIPGACTRIQELLSEELDGDLTAALRGELGSHLEACPACRRLRDALHEVVSTLRREPVPEPSWPLPRRAAEAALARSDRSRASRPWSASGVVWLRTVAASLVITTGLTLTLTGDPARTLSRLYGRSVAFGARVLERAERLVDDLRILKLRLGETLGGDVDRNDEGRVFR
jgi:predicted anti-sigma-YlaC factor YlaD